MDMSSLRNDKGLAAADRARMQRAGRTTQVRHSASTASSVPPRTPRLPPSVLRFSSPCLSVACAHACDQVKNKSPALVQITAEQLLREAQEFKEEITVPPRQEITDPAELKEYMGRKRKEFEDGLRRNNHNMALWMRYAAWESKMQEYARARSVFERALDVDYRNQSMWLKYTEMEMRNRQINHARNLWNRAVQLLPRVDQFWYKFAYMEEMLGEATNARAVFERWMTFQPNEQAWLSFIKFEIRNKNIEGARALYGRFTIAHTSVDAYLKWAKFETRYGSVAAARKVYEDAQEELPAELKSDESYFIAFAHFEERNKEYDRARALYQYALDNLPKHRARELYDKYVQFEKSFGDKEGVELVILSKKRFQYEEELAASAQASGTGGAHNYDVWFDYLRLEQDRLDAITVSVNAAVNNPANLAAQRGKVRELFERAVAAVPLVRTEKKYWKRYIYIWINWIIFEETTMKDIQRTRDLYTTLLSDKLIPHAAFSFAKLWIGYAHFEIRQGKLDAARAMLGQGLGRVQNPRTKAKLFKGYLEFELHLGALDRVRTLYTKLVEFSPSTSESWIAFAQFEARLAETARARTLYEVAVSQTTLDQPERVWKSYIEFETASGAVDHVRALYTRLLERTKHVKVWIAFAQFESSLKTADAVATTRAVFSRGEDHFKTTQQRLVEEEASNAGSLAIGAHASAELLGLKEERLLLLQSWRDFERTFGDAASLQAVQSRLPQQLKKRRPVYVGGEAAGAEEYYDYVFPEESAKAAAAGGSRFMEMAKNWKRQQELKQAGEQARLEAEVEREEQEMQRQRQEEDRQIQQMNEGEIQLDEDEDADGDAQIATAEGSSAAPTSAASAAAAAGDDQPGAMEE